MWKFITSNIREFWRGSLAFSFTSFSFISFQKIIILDYLSGLITIIVSGALGGMATALGAHFFKHKLQNRLFKNKKNGQKIQPRTEESGSREKGAA